MPNMYNKYNKNAILQNGLPLLSKERKNEDLQSIWTTSTATSCSSHGLNNDYVHCILEDHSFAQGRHLLQVARLQKRENFMLLGLPKCCIVSPKAGDWKINSQGGKMLNSVKSAILNWNGLWSL